MTTTPPQPAAGRCRSPRWGMAVGGLLVAAAIVAATPLAAPARAAEGVPPAVAASTARVNVENDPVRYHSAPTATDGGQVATPAADSMAGASHVVLALLVVIGIILGLRWVASKLSLVPPVGRSGRGVRLLSRTVLSPKQQVLLLQVGRRIVVVGDAGSAGMRPLCEITDPDEVAALLGDAKAAEAGVPASRSFASLFRRAADPFDGGGFDAAAEVDAPALAPARAEVPSDVVGLLAKVRGLRQQFDR